jgi:hypothetical protein
MALQQSAVTPEVLLSLKNAIVEAAQQGRTFVEVRFPFSLSATAGETVSSWKLIDLLRAVQQPSWAEAASQAGAAGYAVSVARGPGMGPSIVIQGIRLSWQHPREAAPC